MTNHGDHSGIQQGLFELNNIKAVYGTEGKKKARVYTIITELCKEFVFHIENFKQVRMAGPAVR